MDKIAKILAPTDLSEFSRVGVRYALNLAKAIGAEVTVYNVVSSEEIMRYGQRVTDKIGADPSFKTADSVVQRYQEALSGFLKAHCSDLIATVTVHEKVEIGTPDLSIIEEAKKEGADLIVISTHGRSGLTHILLGSVTEKIVRRAPCPVLSIRPDSVQAASLKTVAA